MYVIFAFQSRAQAMRLYSELKRAGIGSVIINTPREISVGCGLSVKIYESALAAAKQVFAVAAYDAFLGAYRLFNEHRGTSVQRIDL